MQNSQQNYTVLFADITGSTALYDKFGDNHANAIINKALSMMIDTAKKHGGSLIKTIGDEVMCHFPSCDSAVDAACEINELFDYTPPSNEVPLTAKIGLHYGPALLKEDGDLFGDMVNVAARMTGIAQARQIITTSDVVNHLCEASQLKCREFDRAIVKGKSEPLVIYEVVWEPQDVTTLSPRVVQPQSTEVPVVLDIQYGDRRFTVTDSSSPLLIGRGDQCHLVVPSSLASRNHATVQFSRGKFILSDQSTNGTYVQLQSGKQFYLRREQFPVSESGMISLGENFSEGNSHVIYFRLSGTV